MFKNLSIGTLAACVSFLVLPDPVYSEDETGVVQTTIVHSQVLELTPGSQATVLVFGESESMYKVNVYDSFGFLVASCDDLAKAKVLKLVASFPARYVLEVVNESSVLDDYQILVF